jgi:hypothetical protein
MVKRASIVAVVIMSMLGIVILCGTNFNILAEHNRSDTKRKLTLWREQKIGNAICLFRAKRGRFPYGSQRDIFTALSGGSTYGLDSSDPVFIEPSETDKKEVAFCDEWGRALKVTIEGDKNTVQIYSMGKNGKDDGGRNDDIVYSSTCK